MIPTPVAIATTALGALTTAAGTVALYVQAQAAVGDDAVSFSGQALLIVSGLLSIMSGVVTYQARQADKARSDTMAEVLKRMADRDATITDLKATLATQYQRNRELLDQIENVRVTKDEQIFRLLGLGEQATSALDSLAPLAHEVRRRALPDRGGP